MFGRWGCESVNFFQTMTYFKNLMWDFLQLDANPKRYKIVTLKLYNLVQILLTFPAAITVLRKI